MEREVRLSIDLNIDWNNILINLSAGLKFNLMNNANDHFEDYYSLCETFGFFLFDTVLYLGAYYYFGHIFPGVYGTARPFYFPVLVTN